MSAPPDPTYASRLLRRDIEDRVTDMEAQQKADRAMFAAQVEWWRSEFLSLEQRVATVEDNQTKARSRQQWTDFTQP